MNESSRRTLVAFGGVTLVLIGAWMLIERIVVPVFRPLGVVLHTLSQVGWPLALIAVGVLVLTRRVPAQYSGSLVRSRSERVIGGVLGGIAGRLGIDAGIVRIAYVIIALAVGFWPAALFYAIALVAVPEEPAAWARVEDAAPSAPPVP